MRGVFKLFNKGLLKFFGSGVIRVRTVEAERVVLKFRLFDRTIATYEKGKRERVRRDGKNSNPRVVYLKVNRRASYTIPCIQGWLDALQSAGGGV